LLAILIEENLLQGLVFPLIQILILLDDREGRLSGNPYDRAIAYQISEAHFLNTMLSLTKQFSRAAQFKVFVGNFKPVGDAFHDS
jgi:hypothetical protein